MPRPAPGGLRWLSFQIVHTFDHIICLVRSPFLEPRFDHELAVRRTRVGVPESAIVLDCQSDLELITDPPRNRADRSGVELLDLLFPIRMKRADAAQCIR